jgi:hypothetical protein
VEFVPRKKSKKISENRGESEGESRTVQKHVGLVTRDGRAVRAGAEVEGTVGNAGATGSREDIMPIGG